MPSLISINVDRPSFSIYINSLFLGRGKSGILILRELIPLIACSVLVFVVTKPFELITTLILSLLSSVIVLGFPTTTAIDGLPSSNETFSVIAT